jgi:chromosome segregation ATPase
MRNANEAYKQTSDGLIASVEELSKRLNGIDVPEDLVTKKLDPVLLDIERSVARLVDRIEKVEIPEDLISRRIQRVLSHLEGAIYGVSKRIAEIQVDPELMNSAVQRVFEPLDDSMIKLQQTFDATVRSFEKMNARRDEIDKFADVAERLNKEKQNVTAWGITIAENERNLKDLNNDLTKTHDVLGTVVKSVERLGTEASKQQEVHTKAVEQLVVTMRQTQREIQELSKTTEVLSKEFAHAMRQLVDAANFQSSGSRIA